MCHGTLLKLFRISMTNIMYGIPCSLASSTNTFPSVANASASQLIPGLINRYCLLWGGVTSFTGNSIGHQTGLNTEVCETLLTSNSEKYILLQRNWKRVREYTKPKWVLENSQTLLPNKNVNCDIDRSIVDDKEVTGHKDIADAMNSYFTSIASSLLANSSEIESEFAPDEAPLNIEPFKFT